LIENALKFTPPGAQIDVRSFEVGSNLMVEVADNGPGILPEHLQQVFYPFFTTKPVGKGTGLGLSTCYGIATSHKGLIRAENNEMGGATFIVELPLAKSKKQRKSRKAVAVG